MVGGWEWQAWKPGRKATWLVWSECGQEWSRASTQAGVELCSTCGVFLTPSLELRQCFYLVKCLIARLSVLAKALFHQGTCWWGRTGYSQDFSFNFEGILTCHHFCYYLSPGSHFNRRICGQFDVFGFNLIEMSITCLLTINSCSLCLIKRRKLIFSTPPLSRKLLHDAWGSVLVHAEFTPEQASLLPRFISVFRNTDACITDTHRAWVI